MPMAYCGTRIPENPYGVKICRGKRDPHGISIVYGVLGQSHVACRINRRGISALYWLFCTEHIRRGEVAPLLYSGRIRAVRFARLSAHRVLRHMVATHARTHHTRAPRPRATRRTRRACRVEAPPGGDGSGSSDLPPAPTWGHPSHDSTTVDLSFQSSPWRLPSGLRALLAYALLEVAR